MKKLVEAKKDIQNALTSAVVGQHEKSQKPEHFLKLVRGRAPYKKKSYKACKNVAWSIWVRRVYQSAVKKLQTVLKEIFTENSEEFAALWQGWDEVKDVAKPLVGKVTGSLATHFANQVVTNMMWSFPKLEATFRQKPSSASAEQPKLFALAFSGQTMRKKHLRLVVAVTPTDNNEEAPTDDEEEEEAPPDEEEEEEAPPEEEEAPIDETPPDEEELTDKRGREVAPQVLYIMFFSILDCFLSWRQHQNNFFGLGHFALTFTMRCAKCHHDALCNKVFQH